MNDWITIMTFTYPHESYVIRGALESASIETFLKDELTIHVDNFLSNAIGGIRLQVPKDKANEAKQFLRDGGYLDYPDVIDSEPQKIKVFNISKVNSSICPFCQSENIGEKKIPTIWIVLSFFLLYLPLPIFKRNYYCFDCEKEWKISRKQTKH